MCFQSELKTAELERPNKPMKLTVAFGARSLSAGRWADRLTYLLDRGATCGIPYDDLFW